MSTLKSITINLPGSYGVNSIEDVVPAEAEVASRFGAVVQNGVVDVSGKLVSRKDFNLVTTSGSGQVYAMHMHRATDGTENLLVAQAGAVYKGGSNGVTLSNLVSITGLQNASFATLNNYVMVGEVGCSAVILSNGTWTAASPSGQSWVQPAVVVSGYGRMWAANDASVSNVYSLWWSNLLDPLAWASGDAGNLDVTNAWPDGGDEIMQVALSFSRVIIFGRRNILLYTLGSDNDPGAMTLTDTIENIGCIARNSVVSTDDGVYFLSNKGLFRIDRLGQVTSLMTVPEISKLCGADVRTYTAAEAEADIMGGFYPTEGWYLLTFPSSNITMCVHTRKTLPEPFNVPLITFWTNTGMPFRGFESNKAGDFFCGGTNGVYKYNSYTPDGTSQSYNLVFTSQWLNYGDDSRKKHLKGVTLVLKAKSGQTGTFSWFQDYDADNSRSVSFTCDSTEFAEDPGVGNVRLAPLGGSCSVVKYSISLPISSQGVTLNQMRPYANPGAMKF